MADRQITRFFLHLIPVLVLHVHLTSGIWLENADCDSYPDVVPTDAGDFRYHPIYVRLNRCKGASVAGVHHLMSCQPDPEVRDEVEIQVFDMTSSEVVTLRMLNETKCVYKCVSNATVCTIHEEWVEDVCACQCRYHHDIPPPPPECPSGEHWEYSLCKCEPDFMLKAKVSNGTDSALKNETRSKIIDIVVKDIPSVVP